MGVRWVSDRCLTPKYIDGYKDMKHRLLLTCAVMAVAGSAAVYSQGRGGAPLTPAPTPTPPQMPPLAALYEGARLIIGDASPVIENGAFAVDINGRITAIGAKGTVKAPAGAPRVDLTGKTVMPAMVNAHAHFGYERYTTAAGDARPENYTPENLLDHFEREAFYGVGTVNDGGSASVPISLEFQKDQDARKFPLAARYVFNAGIVPPDGGPDDVLIKGTRPLHASYEVIRAPEGRAAVLDAKAKGLTHVKIWMGDRGGSYPAMPYEVYTAVIDEAHKQGIKVHAHATDVRNEKEALKAGADLILHTVGNGPLDDELLAILRDKKPYWGPLIGSGDRSEVCDNDSFTMQVLSAKLIADIQMNGCRVNPNAATRDQQLKTNVAAMLNAGAKLVMATDAGIRPTYSFGSAEHHELTTYVRLGMTPAQAITAATATPAEALGLKNVGTLAAGKDADFIVLNTNPLDNIKNTRDIANVYLHGAKLNRDALLANWKKAATN